MFIVQMEYREKLTATNWKKITFPLQANVSAENPDLALRLLDHIAALVGFALNDTQHPFADAISRIVFKTSHSEFLWFAKSTLQDGQLLVDEEELYQQDNTMLMRRAFEEWTVGDSPAKQIPVAQSMLAQHDDSELLQKLQRGFQLVQYHQLTTENQQQVLQQILKAPHGTLILLDGSKLPAPLDVSDIAQRNDIQLLSVNCKGLPEMTITQKGKMISCQ